jgi:hypothetical protein
VNTQFADAFADRLYVTGISQRQAADPTRDFRLALVSRRPESHAEKTPISQTSIMCKRSATNIYASTMGDKMPAKGTEAMSPPQIVRTPGGDELVVLPRGEYQPLLDRADHDTEDTDDIAVYDARKAELSGGGALVPPQASAAIRRGDSRLKAIRNWRGETQLHLNFKTGIGQGYLPDLENGHTTGTPETIAKLAQALNVPVEWLS